MTKSIRRLLLACFSLVASLSLSIAQDSEPIPTLVPPTLVPTVDAPLQDALLPESGIARILRDNKVRVGILLNEAPFGQLSVRMEIVGFDAELARLIADAWGVEVEFVQVTRQNSIELLQRGDVDLLISAQEHRRELDSVVEFSQTYHIGQQVMMVRADDSATMLGNLIGRRVGYVIGTEAERTINEWTQATGLSFETQFYPNLDRAYVGLVLGEVDGVVALEHRLLEVVDQPDLIRILEEPLARQSYAIVMNRQDVNLRNLVNRTLQYLTQEGTLETLHRDYFPGTDFPADALALWENIGDDTPEPSQFPTDVIYPQQYTTPQVLDNGVVRVAGIQEGSADVSESQRRMSIINRALVEAMAQRWGVSVEYMSSTPEQAPQLVANGQADFAIGVIPNWELVNLVDFTGEYLLFGDRLMVRNNGTVSGFADLRGRWIGIMDNDDGAEERARAWADSINASVRFYTTREQDASVTMLVENNADVIYGNSLKLLPHLENNVGVLSLTDRWYSRSYLAFAVPRNDLDFRLLVEYTLQELVKDGTMEALSQPLLLSEDFPQFDVWGGSINYLGLSLSG